MRSRSTLPSASIAVLAVASVVATSSCGPPPYRPLDDRPKPEAYVPPPARWETYATSTLGPRIDGRRYVVLNGKLAWWEPSGEFVFGPASLPSDLGELYAAPTEKGTALLAKSARPLFQSRFGRGPTKIYRFAGDRLSATTLLHTKDSVRVLGSAYGALVITGTSNERWLLDVESGTTKVWPGIARASWIAFHDPLHGAGAFQGAGLQITADGGATFRPAALPPPLTPEDVGDYEWTSEGIVVHAKRPFVADERAATGFVIDDASGAVSPVFDVEKPLERWLRGRPTGWEPGTWSTLEIASRHGVLARDGGALVAAKTTSKGMNPGGTVFAHMDLSTGFVDFMADAPGRSCFLVGHDLETMWLACQSGERQDSPFWVERVERTSEALGRALAAFPDEKRAFVMYANTTDWDFGLATNLAPGKTLFRGSCRSAERLGFDCLADSDGQRDIQRVDGDPLVPMGSTIVRVSGGPSKLVLRRLEAEGRWSPLTETPLAAKTVHARGAYMAEYGKLVVFVTDGESGAKSWRVDVDTASGQSSIHEMERAGVFRMVGHRGVDISGPYARRTTDGGRHWTDFELLGESEDYVDVTEVGIRLPDAWVIGWDEQKTMPRPPDVAPSADAPDHPYAASPSAPPAGVLVCRVAGKPIPSPPNGDEPPASLETQASADGASLEWDLRWTDAAGQKRKWKGEGPRLSAALAEFHTAGNTTAFLIDVGSREVVVGRAIGDKVELTPALHAGKSRLSVRVGGDGAIAFGGLETFIWPAGKPPESIHPVARVGDDVVLEAVSPGFLTFATSQIGNRSVYPSDRYVSVPNTPASPAPPLPVLGWIGSDAFPLAWSTPCGASPKGRVRVARDVRVVETYALDPGTPPPAFADIAMRTAVFDVGFDAGKPLDPTTTCVAGLTLRSNSGPDADYSFVTKKGTVYLMEHQPIACEIVAEADYPPKP